MPKPWSSDDAALFVTKAKELNGSAKNPVESLDEALLEQFSKICAGDLSPMAASIGGIVAQEVMKACSGKFMPIKQWFMFDATECLPEEPLPPSEFEGVQEEDRRYEGQISVFGKTFQRKLADLRYFLVGAGAIGCGPTEPWGW